MNVKNLFSKRLTILQRISIIVSMFFIVGSSLIFAQSYFNNKEISLFTDQCYNAGGSPTVEMTPLNLGYSFSCVGEE